MEILKKGENSPGAGPRAGYTEGLLLLSMAVLVFLIYSNISGGDFIYDDRPNIRDNPHIRLDRLTPDGIKNAAFKGRSATRPVAYLSFGLNYYIHKYDLTGYHLTNIIIHIAAAIWLYFFIKTTLMLCHFRNTGDARAEEGVQRRPHPRVTGVILTAFSAAVLWAVNPVHTQSVTYIVQRINSLAAMLYILSILMYARGRLEQRRMTVAVRSGKPFPEGGRRIRANLYFAGCIVSGILAFGTKEITATLPFFIILYEWYFFQDLSRTWLKQCVPYIAGLLICASCLAFVYIQVSPMTAEGMLARYDYKNFTMVQRMLTEFRVVNYYVGLLAFPHPSRLTLVYNYPVSTSLIHPLTTLFSLAAVAAVTAAAVCGAKKHRLLSFCALWFLGNLVIESSVVGLALIYEHRTYLPSMMLGLGAVMIIRRYSGNRRLNTALLCAVLVIWSVWTYGRNSVWRDRITFWTDCIHKHASMEKYSQDTARHHSLYEKLADIAKKGLSAICAAPNVATAHYNLAIAFEEQNNLVKAAHHYHETVKTDPGHHRAYNNYGKVLARQGKTGEAVEVFLKALNIKQSSITHDNIGVVMLIEGNVREAIGHFEKALSIDPRDETARAHLKKALETVKGELSGETGTGLRRMDDKENP